MNTEAGFFASMFVAGVAFLSSFYVYSVYGGTAAIIVIVGALTWIGIGLYYKKSGKSTQASAPVKKKNKKNKKK